MLDRFGPISKQHRSFYGDVKSLRIRWPGVDTAEGFNPNSADVVLSRDSPWDRSFKLSGQKWANFSSS
jgi:hypothetical protein